MVSWRKNQGNIKIGNEDKAAETTNITVINDQSGATTTKWSRIDKQHRRDSLKKYQYYGAG